MKKNTTLLIVLMLVFGSFIGCKGKPSLNNPNSNPVVESLVSENKQIHENVDESQETIGEETENIDEQTQVIEDNITSINTNSNSLRSNLDTLEALTSQLKGKNVDKSVIDALYDAEISIRESAATIDTANESIRQSNEAIKAERQELQNALRDIELNNKRAERLQKDLDAKDNVIASQTKRIDELEDAAEQASTKYLGMLIAFGVVIMVLGVLGFFYNFKVGLAMLGIGGITVAVTAGVMYYMGWFAIIGLIIMGVGLLGLIGYLAWAMMRGRTFAKATEENAELIETIKQELTDTKAYEIFGDRIRPGIAHTMQSKSTQREIDKIRRRVIKPKMENTIPRSPAGGVIVKDGVIYQPVAPAPSAGQNGQ